MLIQLVSSVMYVTTIIGNEYGCSMHHISMKASEDGGSSLV